MTDLSNNKCEACNHLTPKLTAEQAGELLTQLRDWTITSGDRLTKRWKFTDFAEALKFVNAVGVIAEEEGHHPDISFGWGYAEVTLTTHAIQGLSKNDFIMAAKIDLL
jgi:4a-hydroxytetrahydrobiopterin dehydratase